MYLGVFRSFDREKMVLVYASHDDEGVETEVKLPAKFEVCGRCEGRGKHDHSSFSNGITSSEWAEWDQDSRESYASGLYDVVCETCKGENVTAVLDRERVPEKILQEIDSQYEQLDRWAAEEAAERRAGC